MGCAAGPGKTEQEDGDQPRISTLIQAFGSKGPARMWAAPCTAPLGPALPGMGRGTRLVWLSEEPCGIIHLQNQQFLAWAQRGVSSQAGDCWGQVWTSGEKGARPLPGS